MNADCRYQVDTHRRCNPIHTAAVDFPFRDKDLPQSAPASIARSRRPRLTNH